MILSEVGEDWIKTMLIGLISFHSLGVGLNFSHW